MRYQIDGTLMVAFALWVDCGLFYMDTEYRGCYGALQWHWIMVGRSAIIMTSVDLNIFTYFLSKTVVKLWSQACPTENRDPDAR